MQNLASFEGQIEDECQNVENLVNFEGHIDDEMVNTSIRMYKTESLLKDR